MYRVFARGAQLHHDAGSDGLAPKRGSYLGQASDLHAAFCHQGRGVRLPVNLQGAEAVNSLRLAGGRVPVRPQTRPEDESRLPATGMESHYPMTQFRSGRAIRRR